MAGFYYVKSGTSPMKFDLIVNEIDQVSTYSQDPIFGFMGHYYSSEPSCFLQAAIHEGEVPTGGESTHAFFYNYENTLYITGSIQNHEWYIY